MSDAAWTLTTTIAAVIVTSHLSGPPAALQTGTAQPTRPGSTASQQNPPTAAQKNSPQYHLSEARRTLDTIEADSLHGEAATRVAELRQQFTQLEDAWRLHAAIAARDGASRTAHPEGQKTTTTAGGVTSGTPAGTSGGTTGTPEQTGATGTRGSETSPAVAEDPTIAHYQSITAILDRLSGDARKHTPPTVKVEAGTRGKLTEIRTHLEQFRAGLVTKE